MKAEKPRVRTSRSLVFEEEAVIAGGLADVWRTLADLPGYAAWNPWLVKAEGDLEAGGVVWADVMLGKKKMRAKHVVLAVEPERRLCWRDAGWNALFVYAQRSRTLEALPDGKVRLRQELLVDGPLRGVVGMAYGDALRAGLAAETAALKRSVEAGGRAAT
jgi:hypothetical protein